MSVHQSHMHESSHPYVSAQAGTEVVTGVQMARMHAVLAPVTRSCSGALRLTGGGNMGQAAGMNHRDMQKGGAMGRGKGQAIVVALSLTASRCNANGIVNELCTHLTAGAGEDAAKSFLVVVLPSRSTPVQATATHGWSM
jgi:hypothetical protein